MNDANHTLKELILGIGFYFVLTEIIGLLMVQDKLAYSLGLLLGCMLATLLAWHMYQSLDKALDMDPTGATKYVRNCSLFRLFLMLIFLFLGRVVPGLDFIAVIIGILGLKISAFFEPLINRYIGKRVKKWNME